MFPRSNRNNPGIPYRAITDRRVGSDLISRPERAAGGSQPMDVRPLPAARRPTHGSGLSPFPQDGTQKKSSTEAGSEQQDIAQIHPGGHGPAPGWAPQGVMAGLSQKTQE